jgi:hypothetical protein
MQQAQYVHVFHAWIQERDKNDLRMRKGKALKGLCHEMNFFCRLIKINISTFYTCADSFDNVLFYSWWRNQTQSFSFLFWTYILNLKIPRVTRIKAAILTLKMIPKAAYDKLILAHFLCSQWEVDTGGQQPITEKGNLRRVSASIFKLVIKEAKKS